LVVLKKHFLMHQLFWWRRKNQGTLTEGEGAVSSLS
jgi:hypothetical protein